MFESPWLNRIFAGFAVGVVIVLLVTPWSRLFVSDADRMLQEASAMLAAERFEEAGVLTWKVIHEQSPPREEATLLAARAGARLKRSQPSFRRQPCDSPPSRRIVFWQRNP